MIHKTRKSHPVIKQKTKTKTLKKYSSSVMPNLSKEQKVAICRKYPNTFEPFEKDFQKQYDAMIKKNPNFSYGKNVVKRLREAYSPSKINPRTDYFSYINFIWMRDTTVEKRQKYIVQIDNFRLLQDKVYYELIGIIKEYTNNNHSKKSTEIKNASKSFIKMISNKQMHDYANDMLSTIDGLRKDKNNLWKMLGLMNQNEIISWGCPMSFSMFPDNYNPKIFRININSPQLTLVDTMVYFDDGTDVSYKNKQKTRYIKFLNDLFHFVFGKNHGFKPKDVYDIEVDILNAMICNKVPPVKNSNGDDDNNIINAKEAKEKYAFDWDAFSHEIGFKKTPEFFITPNLSYLKCGTEMLLNNWDNEKWRTYWIYIYIRQLVSWNHAGRLLHFEYHGKFVRGMIEPTTDEIHSVLGMGYLFNTFLTNEYVARYKNDKYIEYLKTLAEDLKVVFTRMVEKNDWLQPETKKKALLKLKYFKYEIGMPDNLREDPLLEYSGHDAWLNLCKASKWRHDKYMELDGQPIIDIPLMDWATVPPKFIGTQAYVVNASYTASKNGIYIPLGIIQKPFIDLDERGIEYNLAHIGFTLGHEMSHALDNWGSQFDETGKKVNWWTDKDRKHFDKIQKDVIKQYEVFAARDGIKFDAEPSIGEDLADLSGMNIIAKYLADFMEKNKDILPVKTLSIQALYVYLAFQFRQKISKKAINAQLHTNPHPLDKYRINVPLSRFTGFKEIYGVKKGDPMWWHSEDKVWSNP